jgi:URI fold toxin 2
MPHGNSHQNNNQHHLYEIWDKEDEEVFKYGISDDPIDEDGLSARLRNQVTLFNLVANFFRFVGRILRTDIGGRETAEKVEEDFIEDYKQKHGERPRGNPPRKNKNNS